MPDVDEHPKIFSGHSVQRILADAKTHSRRVITLANSSVSGFTRGMRKVWGQLDLSRAYVDPGLGAGAYLKVPNQAWHCIDRVRARVSIGDRLWVRETYAVMWRHEYGCDCEPHPPGLCVTHEKIEYKADSGNPLPGDWPVDEKDHPACPRWRSSMMMPRWASRILLEVVAVRPERLQSISEEDAKAEGVDATPSAINGLRPHVAAFASEWNKLNGARDGCAWADNPWVWVYEFRRLEEAGG